VKRIVWTEPAKSDVRALSKPVAMQVFSVLHRFAESGVGDVKALQGRDELRLRVGDYRLFFVCPDADTIEVRRVRHRAEAYRT
jgi:mRNA interferase RelE/StbE